MKYNYCQIVKLITTVLLVILFVANSWLIFKYYILSKEVTSSSVTLSFVGEQVMPAIIICREQAFSDAKKNMSRLKDYLDNTLSLRYEVLDLKQEYLPNNSPDLKKEQIYSFSRGLCEVLKYKVRAKPYTFLTLEIHPNENDVNEDLQFWITDPGQEYYLHMSVWQDVPFTFKLDSKSESIDIAMKKVVWEKAKQCDSSDLSSDHRIVNSYIGCLQKEFKKRVRFGSKYMLDGKFEKYPNCTMPWHQSMLGDHNYSETNNKPCFGEDGYMLYRLDYEFLSDGVKLRVPNCTVSCKTVTYEARALKFNQDPINVWFGEDPSHDESTSVTNYNENSNIHSNLDENHESRPSNNPAKPRYVYLYFTTPDETTYNTQLMIDFPSFISSIGGNLGLFLGFSCMGVLFPLYEWIEIRYVRSNLIKKSQSAVK